MGANQAIQPLPVPAAAGGLAAFPDDVAFPATRGALATATNARVTQLLQLYNLDPMGTRIERVNQLAAHIGIQGDFA